MNIITFQFQILHKTFELVHSGIVESYHFVLAFSDQTSACSLEKETALDNAVTLGIAMFLHKTLIDSLSGMMMLAPSFLVFVQTFLDDRLKRIQLFRKSPLLFQGILTLFFGKFSVS